MAEKSRLFDDLAGVAGGAFSVFAGMREETEAALKDRFDELVRHLDIASASDLGAVKELAANARAASEDALAELKAIEERLNAIDTRLHGLEQKIRGEGEESENPPS